MHIWCSEGNKSIQCRVNYRYLNKNSPEIKSVLKCRVDDMSFCFINTEKKKLNLDTLSSYKEAIQKQHGHCGITITEIIHKLIFSLH